MSTIEENQLVDAQKQEQLDNAQLQEEFEDAKARGKWTGKLDFILSVIGFAVGLGNVWRFPYLAFKNGGGAFLFPYIIMLFLTGLPLFFLEIAQGQFASKGPVGLFKKLNHYFVGIGWAMVMISMLTSIYYNVILMWAVFYLFASMAPVVPWQTCDPVWASEYCMVLERIEDKVNDIERLEETTKRYNISCLGLTAMGIGNTTIGSYDKIAEALKEQKYPDFVKNLKFDDLDLGLLPKVSESFTALNVSQGLGNVLPSILRGAERIGEDGGMEVVFKECRKRIEIPSGDYFHRYMLEIQNSDGATFYGLGGIKWQLLLVFIFTWLVVFLCLVKGVKSSGKVVYFTATFPYVVLIALLVRGVTLPGCMQGIRFYIIPEWEKLKDPTVWSAAATQIFYSLGPAFGGLMTFSSYNDFNHNCYRDAVLVAFINCGTSIFGGFAVFSIIGFMAYSTGLEVSEVPVSGDGLLFIAYPEAIARMPAPPLWAILFFFMVITLGLDSQFAMMETVISAFADQFYKQLRSRKEILTFVCCFVCFLCGLPCVTYGGMYVVTLMNWYSASYSLMIISFFNIMVVIWIYGMGNFASDIMMMIGHKPNLYWYIMWVFVTPVAILFIIIASAIQDSPAAYRTYIFPTEVIAVGWVSMAVSIVLIPIFFFIELFRYQKTRAALKREMAPSIGWGPALPENRKGKYALDDDVLETGGVPIKNNNGAAESYGMANYAAENTGMDKLYTSKGQEKMNNEGVDNTGMDNDDPPAYDTRM